MATSRPGTNRSSRARHRTPNNPGRHVVGSVDIKRLDITETNKAVQELIEVTENARRRYLLQAYDRHRNLEHAGRFEEIFTPEMTVEHPVYRFNMIGQPPMMLEAASRSSLFTGSGPKPTSRSSTTRPKRWPFGDFMVASTMVGYQQTLGSALVAAGIEADEDAMYLLKGRVAMLWPYDERCRLVGESVWEYDETEHDLIKLDPDEVLTRNRPPICSSPTSSPSRRSTTACCLASGPSHRPAGRGRRASLASRRRPTVPIDDCSVRAEQG